MFSPGNFKRNRRRFSLKFHSRRFTMKKKRVKTKTHNACVKRRKKSLIKRRWFGLDLKPRPQKKRKRGKSIAQFAVENAADIKVDTDTGRVKFSKALSKRLGLKPKTDGK